MEITLNNSGTIDNPDDFIQVTIKTGLNMDMETLASYLEQACLGLGYQPETVKKYITSTL